MPFNPYIELDGKKYVCLHGRWNKAKSKPSRERQTLSGSVDITYGPAVFTVWEGSIRAYVTPQVGYGTPTELELTYNKKESVPFIDHDAGAYTVHFIGELVGDSFLPMYDSASNSFVYKIKLVKAV